MLKVKMKALWVCVLMIVVISAVDVNEDVQMGNDNQEFLSNNNASYRQSLLPNEKVCDGNRFQFLSSFVLGKQNDLAKVFAQIEKTIHVKNITYSDKIGRVYKIFNFKPHLVYLESKQVAEIKTMNVLNISGGPVRLSYTFEWQKQQIGSFINGTGSGVVSSDPVTFEKQLQTNQTHELQWSYKKANNITITNSLTLAKITPYKEIDYEIINQMLNELKNNETTVKTQLIKALNANFISILKNVVKQDETIQIPKQIEYSWNDYRGPFNVTFQNVLLQNYLTKDGLSLILSQVIKNQTNFQCGKKVPTDPENISKYGGNQQYISNTFFNSTLKYALDKKQLDVTLSEQNWQSRAFQFFVGDLHDVITSTRNISSFQDIKGYCNAISDKNLGLVKKTSSSYEMKANFTCYLFMNTTKIVDINIPVEYEIAPTLTPKQLNFVIRNIKGTPTFVQNSKYKIVNKELASFMLLETLNTAVKSKVIGSGYRTKSRKNPQVEVRDDYLFLYDKSTIKQQQKSA